MSQADRHHREFYHIWAGYTLANKIVTMISAIATYDVRVDVAFVAALWVMARIVASGALLRVHTGLLIIALGLLTMALLVPSVLGGTAFVDWRFPIMAVLTAAAALRPGIRSSRAASVVAVTLLILPSPALPGLPIYGANAKRTLLRSNALCHWCRLARLCFPQ